MRYKRFLPILMLACLMVFPIVGCSDEGDLVIKTGDTDGNGGVTPVITNLTGNAANTTVNPNGTTTITVTVTDQNGSGMQGVFVGFTISTNNSNAVLSAASATTNASGQASVTYTAGDIDGVTDTITATAGTKSVNVTINVGAAGPSSPDELLTGGATAIRGAGFFTATDYVGAFDPDAPTSWANGWTIPHGLTSAIAGVWSNANIDTSPFGAATVGGLAVVDNGDGSITISGGTMTEDATLTSDRIWELGGTVFVGVDSPASGFEVTLTIEPGTKIVGLTGLASGIVPRLVISRGNKIMARGTADAPILMTGGNETGTSEWGGLAVNGFAPINRGNEADGEAETGMYGGDQPADNSGILQYVIVAHAGYKFTETKELNGIAFQGVGSGTTVDHIQVHRNADDGVEFFGGTVNVKYVYLTENQDDSLDWTDGWTGNAQFVSIHKNATSGDQGIEADNLEDDNNALPRSQPMLANMTLKGYADNGKGMLLRRGTGVNIYNTIITGFGEGQIDIDSEATFVNAVTDAYPNLSGNFTIENSIVYETGGNLFVDQENPEETFAASVWFGDQNNFASADPQLDANLELTAGSPANLKSGTAFDIAEAGSEFFEIVEYVGAFDPNAAQTWAAGWTIPHGGTSANAGIWTDNTCNNCNCPATMGGLVVTEEADGSCTIQGGTMYEDALLTPDYVWNLGGTVFVGEDSPSAGNEVTLTIEPGTKIVGLTGLASGIVPRLVISRGNRIMALGTADAPILMTGGNESDTSEWGGLAVNGFAPINRGDEADGEAETGMYGGDQPADNSGILQYVIVAHAGYKFTETKELNGIAFQGVGSGTTVDYIQVHRNADDGVEFFGGTVNVKHVYLTENADDSLDWTDGWTGNAQFVSIHKNATSGDQGIEADNLEDDNNALPRSNPVLANMTIVGYVDNGKGMLLRRGTGVNIYNTIITGFGEGQIDIDSEATFVNAVTDTYPNLSGNLTISNSLVWNDGDAAIPLFVDQENPEETFAASDWFNDQNNFTAQDPVLNTDGTLTN